MTPPDVTLLFPTYNPRCLGDVFTLAVDSTLDDHPDVDLELIFCDDSDDGSYDDLIAPLADADPRVRTWIGVGRGPGAAFNCCAAVSTGRYLIQQTARSWYEPGSLKAMVEALDNNPDVGFVYGATEYHGAQAYMGVYRPPAEYVREDFFQSFVSRCGFMYRREAWDAGCRFHYTDVEVEPGVWTGLNDRDMQMQLIVDLGWRGMALPDLLALHYYYSGSNQTTALTAQYADRVNAVWDKRWPMAPRG